jgi:hypothetical protein
MTTILSWPKEFKKRAAWTGLARTLIFLLIKNIGVEARMVVVSKVSKW